MIEKLEMALECRRQRSRPSGDDWRPRSEQCTSPECSSQAFFFYQIAQISTPRPVSPGGRPNKYNVRSTFCEVRTAQQINYFIIFFKTYTLKQQLLKTPKKNVLGGETKCSGVWAIQSFSNTWTLRDDKKMIQLTNT